MFKIIAKEQLSENVFKFIVEAPRVARSRRAGHFVIVRTGDGCERVPLTIADADKEKGTLTLVVQRVGVSTDRMCALNAGDSLADVAGPLGRATHIENFGTVVCAAGGVGGAPMLPIVKALKEAGNRVIVVLAARNAGLIILEKEFREVADEVMIMTDDGSAGTKGLVTAGMPADQETGHLDRRIAQHHHGRWHGHVRRLPHHRGRRDEVRLRRWPRV